MPIHKRYVLQNDRVALHDMPHQLISGLNHSYFTVVVHTVVAGTSGQCDISDIDGVKGPESTA